MKGDFDMEKHITNEETGIQYTLVGAYYLPNIELPPQDDNTLGRFGQMRLQYLKNHRKILYTQLLTSGTLNTHLHEIDETSLNRFDMLVRQMAEAQGVTERLKSDDQMAWVGAMNNIRACAVEVIQTELIFQ